MSENTATNNVESLSKSFFGRRKIYIDEVELNRDNIVQILNMILPQFHENQYESVYLYNYYRGNQPILYRQKPNRPEINNKIVENHAFEFVNFKTQLVLSEPLTYTRRESSSISANNTEPDDIISKIDELNKIMSLLQSNDINKQVVEWMNICGHGFKYCITDDNGQLAIGSLDPRNTEIVYSRSLGNPPIFALQEIRTDDDTIFWEIYGRKKHFVVKGTDVTETPHTWGDIPIFEYELNNARMGVIETVITLLDAINMSSSDRLNSIVQNVQSFLRCINCRLDEKTYEQLRAQGMLSFTSDSNNPASVDFISNDLDQSAAQIEVDHLYQQALIISNMPDRKGTERANGDTGQAVALRDGWTAAESSAKDTQQKFATAEMRFVRMVTNILRKKGTLNLNPDDISIRFVKNSVGNVLAKVQVLEGLLRCGVSPEIAFQLCDIFDDPNNAYLASKDFLDQTWNVSNNQPNVENNNDNMAVDESETT